MRLRQRSHRLLLYAVALSIASCESAAVIDGSRADATHDAGRDASRDVGADLGPPDAGRRDSASWDLGNDVGADADPWTGTPCSVGAAPGRCMDVTECSGMSTPGLCPGPSHIQCCTSADAGALDAAFDSADAGICDPEAMPQPNAGLVEEAGSGGCPSGMLRVDDFCVDRFEASLLTLDGAPWSPFFNPGATAVPGRDAGRGTRAATANAQGRPLHPAAFAPRSALAPRQRGRGSDVRT